jgi:hypothetical protein
MEIEISSLAEQLISTKMSDETLKEIKEIFYQIVRDNGIKQGTRSQDGRGRICDNPEWVMCKEMFLETIKSQINISLLFDDVPDDLKA